MCAAPGTRPIGTPACVRTAGVRWIAGGCPCCTPFARARPGRDSQCWSLLRSRSPRRSLSRRARPRGTAHPAPMSPRRIRGNACRTSRRRRHLRRRRRCSPSSPYPSRSSPISPRRLLPYSATRLSRPARRGTGARSRAAGAAGTHCVPAPRHARAGRPAGGEAEAEEVTRPRRERPSSAVGGEVSEESAPVAPQPSQQPAGLPFTGFDAGLIALMGIAFVAAGLLLRRHRVAVAAALGSPRGEIVAAVPGRRKVR